MSKILAVFGGSEHTFSSYISPSELTRIPQVSGHFKSGSLRRGQHRSNRHSLFRGELERQSAHRQEGRQAGRQVDNPQNPDWILLLRQVVSQPTIQLKQPVYKQSIQVCLWTRMQFLFRGSKNQSQWCILRWLLSVIHSQVCVKTKWIMQQTSDMTHKQPNINNEACTPVNISGNLLKHRLDFAETRRVWRIFFRGKGITE